ncbi:MAG: mechanosensitive ion channel [Flavobacteriales bacterium]|nr:mechanosensitive ion channel [Flavobacteriales bacterium]
MIEAKKALDLVRSKLLNWLEGLVVMLPNLALATLIVVGFWLLAKLVRNVANKLLLRFFESGTLQRLFANTLYVAIVLVGGFTALSVLHLDKTVTSLLAGVGILGLALGFAFQDIASNFIAGILMAAQRPLQPGDLVETGGQFGVVERIDLRTTQLRDLQGRQVIIPNKDIFQKVLVNYTRNGIRRVDLPIGLGYSENLEYAKQVTVDAVRSVPDVLLEKGVDLFYQEFAASSINLEVRFWIASVSNNHFHTVRSKAIMAIVAAYRSHNITIPYPIRTIELGKEGKELLSTGPK